MKKYLFAGLLLLSTGCISQNRSAMDDTIERKRMV